MLTYPYALDKRIIETLQESGHEVDLCDQGFHIQSPPHSTYRQEDLFPVLQISSYMLNLPDEELLICAVTEDLEKFWRKQRNLHRWIAIAFVDEGLGLEIQPLRQLRREGEIEHIQDQQTCESYARSIYARWKLIEVGFPVISREYPDIANTAFELLCKMLDNTVKFGFEQRSKTFNNSVPDRCRFSQKQTEVELFSAEERESLLDHPLVYRDELMGMIYPILEEAAENNHEIDTCLNALNDCSEAFDRSNIQVLKARNAQGQIHKSERWRKGRHIPRRTDGSAMKNSRNGLNGRIGRL